MAQFHKVTTRITDRRATMVYSGVVELTEYVDYVGHPDGTFVSTPRADIYEDFFLTKDEAMLFIRTNKEYL